MTHAASTRSIHSLAAFSPGFPSGRGSGDRTRFAVETGAVVARVFDLFEGTGLEPFAAEVARGLVDRGRCRPQR